MPDYRSDLMHVAQNNKRIFKQSPDVGKAFMALHDAACQTRALDHKQKELISLGIAICIRCEGCILSHVNAALEHGATMAEISDTVDVAIMMGGGPSMVYGGKAIECAEQFIAAKNA